MASKKQQEDRFRQLGPAAGAELRSTSPVPRACWSRSPRSGPRCFLAPLSGGGLEVRPWARLLRAHPGIRRPGSGRKGSVAVDLRVL